MYAGNKHQLAWHISRIAYWLYFATSLAVVVTLFGLRSDGRADGVLGLAYRTISSFNTTSVLEVRLYSHFTHNACCKMYHYLSTSFLSVQIFFD